MKRKIARLLLVLNPVPSARLRHWPSTPKQREREREGGDRWYVCAIAFPAICGTGQM